MKLLANFLILRGTGRAILWNVLRIGSQVCVNDMTIEYEFECYVFYRKMQ